MGNIGSYVYEQITTQPQLGLEVAFVCDPSADRLKNIPPHLVLADLAGAKDRHPDLIVEMAHPNVTQQWGETFLTYADYMPLSLTAFADAQLHERILATATRQGTCLYVPHGALVGLDSIFECRDVWEEVIGHHEEEPAQHGYDRFPAVSGQRDRGADGPLRWPHARDLSALSA